MTLLFSIFWGLFGFPPSTHRYEQRRRRMTERYTQYHGIAASEAFKRFLELEGYVNSPNYENDMEDIKSLVYKGSPESLVVKRYHELRKYKEIKAYTKKGVESDSPLLKEFKQLQQTAHSTAFKQRVVYLKNKQKHKESDAYKQLQEYRQLKKSSVIKEYYRLEKKYKTVFQEMDSWTTVLADEFQDGRLNTSRWNTQSFWGLKMPMAGYVQNTEYQHTDPACVAVKDHRLCITTHQATQRGMAWDKQFGFMPRQFDYTSGMVNTVDKFEVQYGKIEVKLRFSPVKNIYHAFWLNSSETTPAISVFNYCNHSLETGIYRSSGNDHHSHRIRFNAENFYVIEMEWNEHHISWRLNGKEIAKKANTVNTPLYLHLASGIIGKIRAEKLPCHFEIDRIKVYKKMS